MKDRLYQAQGLTSSPQPEFPFTLVSTQPRPLVAPQATPSEAVPTGRGGASGRKQNGTTSASRLPGQANSDGNPFARRAPPPGEAGLAGGNTGSQGSFVGGQEPDNPIPPAYRKPLPVRGGPTGGVL